MADLRRIIPVPRTRLGHVLAPALLGAVLVATAPAGITPASASSPGPAAGTCAAWGVLGTPVLHQVLSGVTYLGGGKALVVGWNGELVPPQDLTPRRELWTGSGWKTVSGPQPGAGESMSLTQVARIDGTNTAWAIGDGSFGARIEKYTGSAFVLSKTLPNRMLMAIDVDPSRVAWAVGVFDPFGSAKPLVLRRTGGAWRAVTLPALPSGILYDVTARTASDVWAVGETKSGSPLILRWNGSAWKRVQAWRKPDGVASQDPQGIVAVSRTRVIVVGGETTTEVGAASRPFAMVWNGSGWRRRSVPGAAPDGGYLQDVTVTPGGTVYAVGGIKDAPTFQALIVRASGSTWTRMPFSSAQATPLRTVAARSDAELMAVGSVGFGSSYRVPMRCTP